jgi:hypothetical protein
VSPGEPLVGLYDVFTMAAYKQPVGIVAALVGCYGHKNKPGIMSPVYYFEILANSNTTIIGNNMIIIKSTFSPPIA